MVAMIRRGEIWVARLNPNRGHEIGKARPVLVLQEDRLLDSGLSTVISLPLTTQFRPSFGPLRIRIAPRDRLLRECYVAIEQIRALDRSRFSEGPLAVATPAELREIEKSLQTVLGLDQVE